MTDRHTLHALIDQIPGDGIEDAGKLLKEYLDSRDGCEDEDLTPPPLPPQGAGRVFIEVPIHSIREIEQELSVP
jgi:hypothetical protein